MISQVQSHYHYYYTCIYNARTFSNGTESEAHEGSPMSKEEKLRLEGFLEKVGLNREWKSEGVMDAESGDDGSTSQWGGESRQDLLGWRNEVNLEVLIPKTCMYKREIVMKLSK